MVSLTDWRSSAVVDDILSLYSSERDVEELTDDLLSFLHANPTNSPAIDKSIVKETLSQADTTHRSLIQRLNRQVEEANAELENLRSFADTVELLLQSTTSAAILKLGGSGFDACKRRHRDSEDSQKTMLNKSGSTSMTSIAYPGIMDENHVSVGSQTSMPSSLKPSSSSWSEWFGRKHGDKTPETLSRGSAKLKSWFKKFVHAQNSHTTPVKVEIVYEIEDDCAVGREVLDADDDDNVPTGTANVLKDSRIEGALQTSNIVLNLSRRDLHNIYQSLDTVGRLKPHYHTTLSDLFNAGRTILGTCLPFYYSR
jgi:hypothetical protein